MTKNITVFKISVKCITEDGKHTFEIYQQDETEPLKISSNDNGKTIYKSSLTKEEVLEFLKDIPDNCMSWNNHRIKMRDPNRKISIMEAFEKGIIDNFDKYLEKKAKNNVQ